jgi:hypothetical protein
LGRCAQGEQEQQSAGNQWRGNGSKQIHFLDLLAGIVRTDGFRSASTGRTRNRKMVPFGFRVLPAANIRQKKTPLPLLAGVPHRATDAESAEWSPREHPERGLPAYGLASAENEFAAAEAAEL